MAVQGMAESRGKHFPACQSHSNPLFTTLVMLTGIVGSDVVQEPNGISCGMLKINVICPNLVITSL